MLTHARAATALRRVPPSVLLEPPNLSATLLEALGEIEDEVHILVLGRGGSDLMCALLRAGAPRVTHFRSQKRLEADSASLVVVPDTCSVDWLESALLPIRRALCANGRLVVCVDPLPAAHKRVCRLLCRFGFVAIRAGRAAISRAWTPRRHPAGQCSACWGCSPNSSGR